MDEVKLQPCECGGEPELWLTGNNGVSIRYFYKCSKCGAKIACVETPLEAAEKWQKLAGVTQTNLEWLKSLSAEEFAEKISDCCMCATSQAIRDFGCTEDDCRTGKLAWLNAEHKD